jgi:hypothetical protein
MHGAITKFFGGVDLGMRAADVARRNPGLEYLWEDDRYFGPLKSDSSLSIELYAPSGVPIWPFTNYAGIESISAKLIDESHLLQKEASAEHWIQYFRSILGLEPEHYLLRYSPNDKLLVTNWYLWRLPDYYFQIYEYTPKSGSEGPSILFSARRWQPEVIHDNPIITYYRITGEGDTVRVNKAEENGSGLR